ncbi:MAG: ATP-NAD kinase family protein [Candidatus Bathyarchaeota archaeon]
MKAEPFKLGFVVNPVAGMGGRVGLKGTDGEEILRRAIELGAKAVAPARAKETLKILATVKDDIQLITYPHEMGEDEAKECGFNPTVIGSISSGKTTEADTKKAVKDMSGLKVNLVLFVGGDGTARNIYEAVGEDVPVIGVPSGVKIHSAVYAVDPMAAAAIVIRFLWEGLPLREVEVMDVDEEAFREGRVSARLYGYVLTPYETSLIQGIKTESMLTEAEIRNQAALAVRVIEEMNPDVIYIVGPGTTTRTIGDLLDAKKTLLGVDLFYNKKLLSKDVDEKEILKAIKGRKAKIIVTPIGGHGFIFGRGNLQISPKVIREVGIDNIAVIATKHKVNSLKSLRTDTGDPKLDTELRRPIKVLADYGEDQILTIE